MSNFFKKYLKISEEKYYLKVVSQGERSQFSVVLTNAQKIHKAIQASNKKLILLDYTLTIFKLPHNEAFNLLKIFELQLTEFKEVKMAVVINTRTEEIGSFWSSICRKRGFDYQIFRDESAAKEWLLDNDQAG